jgi:YfiH family protein
MTLEIITSDTLAPCRHGFFTRLGGASSGIFSGLNCGTGSSDQSEAVAMNRTRVHDAMGGGDIPLMGVHQIHSADVVHTTGALGDRPKADGIVTRTPGVTLSILTADCQPVLFADRTNHVIGAAHAGWRGTLAGVLENTVSAMVNLGAERTKIRAVIGPCISQSAYEVGQEFYDEVIAHDPEADTFFTPGVRVGKYQFDLAGLGLKKLYASGIEHAEWVNHCTYQDPKRFYSYRRSVHEKHADYGRLISCIRL